MYLCSNNRFQRRLYLHLIQFHKLTKSSAEIICQAIQNNEDPLRRKLFQINDIVIDRNIHFQCPFSIHNHQSSIIDKSSEHYCRSRKPQLANALRQHLIHSHQMTIFNAKKLVKKLKLNSNKHC